MVNYWYLRRYPLNLIPSTFNYCITNTHYVYYYVIMSHHVHVVAFKHRFLFLIEKKIICLNYMLDCSVTEFLFPLFQEFPFFLETLLTLADKYCITISTLAFFVRSICFDYRNLCKSVLNEQLVFY